jgi:hypothetical protein
MVDSGVFSGFFLHYRYMYHANGVWYNIIVQVFSRGNCMERTGGVMSSQERGVNMSILFKGAHNSSSLLRAFFYR